MLLFNEEECVCICLKNKNEYVRIAVEDLRHDFLRVSHLKAMPKIVSEEVDRRVIISSDDDVIRRSKIRENRLSSLIIIEENYGNGEAIFNESFRIDCDGNRIRISAASYLGTLWGIYTFSERVLEVSPCYLFDDLEINRKTSLSVEPFSYEGMPEKVCFRGVFINDEDLLGGYKKSGGKRLIDYPFYSEVISEEVADKIAETAVRLKFNLVIPSTFIDIDNPPEKAVLDRMARRGVFISQHHIEPLGMSHFAFENYCKKRGIDGDYSFKEYPELMREAWAHYAKKWACYENVVWQAGLRGKADRPVWEESEPTEKELKNYAEYISKAIKEQVEIAKKATGNRAKYFTSTLWMEGSMLMQKGLLDLGNDVITVFSDNGPNQMFGGDYDEVKREEGKKYGVYYHVQYYDIGPHLAPQTGIKKLYYNIKRAKTKGDDDYFILNVSNIREFVFEIKAYSEMVWNFGNFSADKYLSDYSSIFGNNAQLAKGYIEEYFSSLPCIENEYLKYVHSKYFNYNYGENVDGVKNFVLKDGLILWRGAYLVNDFKKEQDLEFLGKVCEKLKEVLPIYEKLSDDFGALAEQSGERVKRHINCKWRLYSITLSCAYKWFICVFKAKKMYDKGDDFGAKRELEKACGSLVYYLDYRKIAEIGDFENWFKGDKKMDVRQKLAATENLLKSI